MLFISALNNYDMLPQQHRFVRTLQQPTVVRVKISRNNSVYQHGVIDFVHAKMNHVFKNFER